jgi:leucyl aminopeptidase
VTIEFELRGARPAEVECDLLAVPVFAGGEPGPGADAADASLGDPGAFFAAADFEGKPGQALVVPAGGGAGATSVLFVGVGARDEVTLDGLRRAAATVARRAKKAPTVATTLLDAAPDGLDRPQAAQALAEGFVLGSYQFLRYKGGADASQLARVVLLGRGGARVARALGRGAAVADAVTWARDLVNEPALGLGPADVVDAAKARLKGRGVRITVWEGDKLVEERMGGVVGVGQGSARPPKFMKIVYTPSGTPRGSVALVGKGVVFDTGGISIKPADGMEAMKTDMSGAAAVLAAMSALRDLDVRCAVTAYVPLAENMPSGSAIRPGDVLRHRNGKTSEVINTDAEGRLILADALALADEDAHDAVIDLATLTGACQVALGQEIAGLMGNHDGWIEQVRAAAERAGEPVWHLPLPKEYRKQLDSDVADLRNTGSRWGGALTAGLFLSEFAGDRPWAHLDIAGPARSASDEGYLCKGGTGFGVRTLLELTTSFTRPHR